MFWRKKEDKEFNIDLDAEVSALKTRLTRIETEVLDIAQSQQLIRDKIMRKIRLKSVNDDEEEETWSGIPKAKSINTKAF